MLEESQRKRTLFMAKSSPRLSKRPPLLSAATATTTATIDSPTSPPSGRSKRQHPPSAGFVLYKNAAYAIKVEAKRRRWKSLKQLLDLPTTTDSIDGDDGEEEGSTGIATKKGSRSKKRASARPVDLAALPAASTSAAPLYRSLDAAPSSLPPQHYCDITGLPARYRDPKTGLWFADKSVFAYARGLSTQRQQQFLQLRNAGVNI